MGAPIVREGESVEIEFDSGAEQGSVSQMVKNGNKLFFDQDGSGKDTSYIQNKRTNEKIWLRPENGVYVLDLMVAPPQMSSDRSTDSHFHRQG